MVVSVSYTHLVILRDVADGLLPKTLPGPDASSQELDAYEEERRLFYVGMTRAKEELWVMRFRRSELTSRFASSLFPKSKEETKKAVPLSPRAVPDLVAIEQTSRRCIPGAVSYTHLIGSSFAAREQHIPFFGLYGACSTMGEGLILASMALDGDFGRRAGVMASSHFCTACLLYTSRCV